MLAVNLSNISGPDELRRIILGTVSKRKNLHKDYPHRPEFVRYGICPHSAFLEGIAEKYFAIPPEEFAQFDDFCGWDASREDSLGPLAGFQGTHYTSNTMCTRLIIALKLLLATLEEKYPEWIIKSDGEKLRISSEYLESISGEPNKLSSAASTLKRCTNCQNLLNWIKKQFPDISIAKLIDKIRENLEKLEEFTPQPLWFLSEKKPTMLCELAPKDYDEGIRA